MLDNVELVQQVLLGLVSEDGLRTQRHLQRLVQLVEHSLRVLRLLPLQSHLNLPLLQIPHLVLRDVKQRLETRAPVTRVLRREEVLVNLLEEQVAFQGFLGLEGVGGGFLFPFSGGFVFGGLAVQETLDHGHHVEVGFLHDSLLRAVFPLLQHE